MVFALLFTAQVWAGSVTESLPKPAEGSPHYDLEVLYHEQKYKEGLAAAEAQLAAAPDAALYWHASRFMFEVGEGFARTDTSIDKVAHYEKMADYAEKGLLLAPDDMNLRFSRGIAYGRLGTTRGVLSSLFLAKDVEADWLAVASSSFKYSSIGGEQLLPCDSYQTLGIFYRLVPEAWIVQAIAGTRGDLQKSVDYHKKSNSCAPGRIGASKELGVSLLCFGEKRGDQAAITEGMGVLSRTSAMVPTDATERTDIKHVAMLMSDPSLACGYSRDGQQDLDEAQLEAKK